MIDQQLLNGLGEFLYKLAEASPENLKFIKQVCLKRCSTAIEHINLRLAGINVKFEKVRNHSTSPNRHDKSPGGDSSIHS